ncbi:MAG: hypothetical protein B6D61_14295 [Bacteroidetes bacterium 4484_249]|nr:MAG: hypothetical protein B6D61_14295 [Bacteroidetes bacterium 4484_249]
MKEIAIAELLDESIKLELTVAGLYELFHNYFPEDSDFWWKLLIEEKGHAAVLRSGKETFLPLHVFPENLISKSIQDVSNVVAELEEIIKLYKVNPPSRTEAFSIALKYEMSAGEVHLQDFMEAKSNNRIEEIFQKMINGDQSHVSKLLEYMKKNNVEVVNK